MADNMFSADNGNKAVIIEQSSGLQWPLPIGREADGRFDYSWREAALYALAVGARRKESEYLYEKELHILPCFGVIPYWGSFGWQPPRALPQPLPMQLGWDKMRSLHMAHRLLLHQPLPPYGGSFAMHERITGVYDHRGRGTVVRSELTACDDSGQPVFTNIGDVLFRGYGCAGVAYRHPFPPLPQGEPEARTTIVIGAEQHLLYRLCGDTNTGHVDDELMRGYGRQGAIMQGLCTLGMACREVTRLLWPQREQRLLMEQRVCELGGELRGIVYPASRTELRLWRVSDDSAAFSLLDESGAAVLDRALLRWR